MKTIEPPDLDFDDEFWQQFIFAEGCELTDEVLEQLDSELKPYGLEVVVANCSTSDLYFKIEKCKE